MIQAHISVVVEKELLGKYVWRVFPQLTEHMSSIQPGITDITDEFLDAVERFVVLYYDHKFLAWGQYIATRTFCKERNQDSTKKLLRLKRHFVNILKGPNTKMFSYGVRRSLPSQFCPVCLTGDGSLMIKVGPPIGHHYHKLRTYAMS